MKKSTNILGLLHKIFNDSPKTCSVRNTIYCTRQSLSDGFLTEQCSTNASKHFKKHIIEIFCKSSKNVFKYS